MSDVFLESQHADSQRFAIFEDDGTSAWLYLTERNEPRPIAEVWVYNRIPAPSTKEIKSYRGGPPPAAIGYASDNALCENPRQHEWKRVWSDDGESIALLQDDQPIAGIINAEKQGYNRDLIAEGPWGHPWSNELYKQVF